MDDRSSLDRIAAETLEQAAAAGSLSVLTGIFAPAFLALGFHNFTVSRTRFRAGRRVPEHLHGQFDLGLIAYGIEHDFSARHAAYDIAVRENRPVFWSDLDRASLLPGQSRLMDECGEWGIREALVLTSGDSTRGPNAVFLASEEAAIRSSVVRGAALRLASAYEAAVHRFTRQDLPPRPAAPRLTARQLECLKWASAGKSAADIADILSLSARTVEEHIAGACKRLGVRSRIQAVAVAVTMGLIQT